MHRSESCSTVTSSATPVFSDEGKRKILNFNFSKNVLLKLDKFD